jgi:hypothetical protein
MGCSSESRVCECVCIDGDGSSYNWDCGSKENKPPSNCCPDPCTTMKLVDVKKDESKHHVLCKRDSRKPPDPFYMGADGVCTLFVFTYTYDCVPKSPPCTTPPPTTPPPGDCSSSGG